MGRRLLGIDKNIVRKPIEDLKGYFQNGTIFINSSENEAEQALTLRHEEGHAVLWALEATFPFPSQSRIRADERPRQHGER